MRLLTLATLCAIALPLPALAQEKGLFDLPAGQTVINLSTVERVEVDQDLLVARLRFEGENKDARALQDQINTTMKKALDAAKAKPDVKVTTQQYYVYPVDPIEPVDPAPHKTNEPKEKAERTWRGSQDIEIKSAKADTLLELAGALQDMGLVMSGLSYTLSPDKAQETQESLMESALAKLGKKADRAAKALGKSGADLLEVNVDSGGYYPQPVMMRAMAADSSMSMKEMAAPVTAPGQTEITMTVSAKALLKP